MARTRKKPAAAPAGEGVEVTDAPACLIIGDPGFRYIELGAGYYAGRDPQRQTRNKIRELEKLNPGMTVTLTPHAAATEPRPPDHCQYPVHYPSLPGVSQPLTVLP